MWSFHVAFGLLLQFDPICFYNFSETPLNLQSTKGTYFCTPVLFFMPTHCLKKVVVVGGGGGGGGIR